MPEQMNIQWYIGHMEKARRQMERDLKLVDAVCEVLDARIPLASRNPAIAQLLGRKPHMVALNRADLADPALTAAWAAYFRTQGIAVVITDCKSRKGISQVAPALRGLLSEKIARSREKGQANCILRMMVVGIPNVGKSTFINQLAGRKGAKAENRPGVTRGNQWVTVAQDFLLLDTPGILWPKFEDPEVGLRLAYTGAVKDTILDTETLGCNLIEMLYARYPDAIRARYKLEEDVPTSGYELLQAAGRKRGFLLSRGEIDTERMARVLLEEYRSAKLGRFTLEVPPHGEEV